MVPPQTIRRTLLVSITLLFASGCAGIRHFQEDATLKMLAHKAYLGVESKNCEHPSDFAKGWKQAYYNISMGSDPCPPTVPPQRYWSAKYQSAAGRRKIACWFAGYEQGVAAAQRDCRDYFSDVPVGAYCQRDSVTKCTPTDPTCACEGSELRAGFIEVGEATSNIAGASFERSAIQRLPSSGDNSEFPFRKFPFRNGELMSADTVDHLRKAPKGAKL